jgi:hypothetical protein
VPLFDDAAWPSFDPAGLPTRQARAARARTSSLDGEAFAARLESEFGAKRYLPEEVAAAAVARMSTHAEVVVRAQQIVDAVGIGTTMRPVGR